MEFRIADTFTDSLARLTGDEQKAVKTTAFDLQLNPASPGMQFHKLDKAKAKDFWSVRVSSGIRLKTQVNPKFGACAVREFVLDASRPLVHVRQKLLKTEGKPVGLTAWTVSQVRQPDFTLPPSLPAAETQRFKTLAGKVGEPQVTTHKSVVAVRYDEINSLKVGVAPDVKLRDGWVAAAFGKTLIVQSQVLKNSTAYPDGGVHAEIFTASRDLGRYVELELLSPVKELKPCEELASDQVWQLLFLEKAQANDPERAGAAARAAHASALKILET